jgi:hypothetical protein
VNENRYLVGRAAIDLPTNCGVLHKELVPQATVDVGATACDRTSAIASARISMPSTMVRSLRVA